ncbi:glycine zipper 2TM domain-containing protein [Dyella monticola]|uniref:Glycine zipper 2TM domain-containing protein n=1 Tax=Dyella monticola TaxID=1927958 RepID=A0A370WXH6_9GAMM|nr:glycine zipper 2TM domain-containing protein [Dyella monticola]RDS80839.1 glycine zipper 2TM domain-containing protein [Dyella monticola]
MSKWVLKACCMAGMATAAAGLTACSHQANADPAVDASAQAAQASGPQYAQVVSVTPVHQMVNNPQQVCQDVVVNHTAPPKDQHHIAGTAIGAVAGGLLGHLVGHGKGNTLATVAGAAAGGYAGNRIEAAHQHDRVYSTTEHECKTVTNATDTIVGYDVQYVYNGVTRTARMDHDPGNRVQVQEGVVSVSDAQ